MDFNMWYIFASLLLVSVGARRYDQGPQTFFDVSSDSSTAEQNVNEEVIVYLTPDQLRALEADGAVVSTDDDTENEKTESSVPSEPQIPEDQEEVLEQDENEPSQQEETLPEEAQQEEEAQQGEQENPENIQSQDIDFEEILRILNEEVEEGTEEAEEPARNEPQVEEENTESPRNFSPRIVLPQQQQQTLPKQQQQQRYLAPSVAKQEVLKSYSLIRYQPNQQRQVINFQIQQQENASDTEETSEVPQTEAPAQEKKKFKLIPYEVEEAQEPEQIAEEPAQETSGTEQDQRLNNFIAALRATRFSGTYGQRKNRLQSMLLQYKVSPKYLQKQNGGAKTEIVPKGSSGVNKQFNKKRLQKKYKQGVPALSADSQIKQKKSQKSFASVTNARPIPVPVLKNQKAKAQKSIFVPVETEQRIYSRNVKTKTNKPYLISRRAPENKRQSPVEVRYLRGPRD